MKAHLVDFNFMTRVVLPDNATNKDIINAAVKNMRERLRDDHDGEWSQAAGEPTEDVEVPFDPGNSNDLPGGFGFYPELPVEGVLSVDTFSNQISVVG